VSPNVVLQRGSRGPSPCSFLNQEGDLGVHFPSFPLSFLPQSVFSDTSTFQRLPSRTSGPLCFQLSPLVSFYISSFCLFAPNCVKPPPLNSPPLVSFGILSSSSIVSLPHYSTDVLQFTFLYTISGSYCNEIQLFVSCPLRLFPGLRSLSAYIYSL